MRGSSLLPDIACVLEFSNTLRLLSGPIRFRTPSAPTMNPFRTRSVSAWKRWPLVQPHFLMHETIQAPYTQNVTKIRPSGGVSRMMPSPTRIVDAASSPRKRHRYPPPRSRTPSYRPRCHHRRPQTSRKRVRRRRGFYPPLCCSAGSAAPRCP